MGTWDEAFLLTPDTGLIGMPTQSVDGIHVRALLNPCFRAGAQVKLQNSSIVMAQINPAYADVTYNAPIDLDGAYKIYSVSHTGDTRGNDYYTDMICTGLNTPPPLSVSPASRSAAASSGRLASMAARVAEKWPRM